MNVPPLQEKVELFVSGTDTEALDLYHVARILHAQFPDHSITELAWHVAEVAIARGARYLIWDPPPE